MARDKVSLGFVPGELNRIRSLFKRGTNKVDKEAAKAMQALGDELAAKVQKYILSNKVKPKTVWKYSRDPRTLIDSGAYVNSIQAKLNPKAVYRKRSEIVITVTPMDEHGNIDYELAAIGMAHEYGIGSKANPQLPLRPHWAPVVRRMKGTKSYENLVGGRFLSIIFAEE